MFFVENVCRKKVRGAGGISDFFKMCGRGNMEQRKSDFHAFRRDSIRRDFFESGDKIYLAGNSLDERRRVCNVGRDLF